MNALADQFNADLRIARIAVSYQTANSLIFSAERILIIWMAALAVLDQKFSIGMVFAFISYKDQFSQRVASLIDKLFELRMLRLHGERVADILLTQPESEQHLNEYDPAQLKADIEFRNVSFRYADGEPYILRNLNLHIREGQFVAITGPSGCGKTTLMKLMLGLLEPSEGEILISGIRLQQLGLANFRRLLGTVMQDDQLFAGSIADNIAFLILHRICSGYKCVR
jgi:ATP-binding cassette subfamily B protein RaxB